MYVSRDYCGGFGSAFPVKKGFNYSTFPPIFDAYAASMLEREGHSVGIIDAQAEKISAKELLAKVEKENPQVIFSRISLPSSKGDFEAVDLLKSSFPDTSYAGWGSICKVEPKVVLLRSKLDLVVRDELEFVVADLVKAIKGDKDLNHVKGISFKTPTGIVHNSSLPFEKDLDVLPFPAYHLLDMKKYVASESYFFPGGSKNKTVNFFTILGSRGCNINCMYCAYPVIFGPWRALSPRRVVDEIEFVVRNYGIRVLWFHDQLFTMVSERTERICDEIINRQIHVTWACETHVKNLPDELVQKMKQAGCTRIQVGIETGDPELLANVGKRGCTVEEVEKVLFMLREEGILVESNFIVGLPGENWNAVRNTGRMIRKTKPDDVSISMITPYPGTSLFNMAKEKGWIVSEDWTLYTTGNPVMTLPNFSGKDMRDAARYLYGTFLWTKGLTEITRQAKEDGFRKLVKTIVSNLPAVGSGAYLIMRSQIRHKINMH